MYLVTVNENKFASKVVSTERNSISGLIMAVQISQLKLFTVPFPSEVVNK
jgi:hypothetical protein